MYRTRLGRYIFFCLFLVISCQKIHFIVFFGAFYLPHLMHSVGAIFIMSDSECAPDSFDA